MRKLMSLAVICSIACVPVLVGREREIADTETVKVKDNGTVVKHKEEVTEKADGTIVKEESHSVNK